VLRSPPASPSCSELAARDGLSLPPNNFPLPGCHSKINDPGLALRCLAELRSEPVRSAAPPPQPGSPRLRGIQRNKPVVQFSIQRFLRVIEPPLPFGVLGPLWIEAFSPLTCRKARLCAQPDFPSLPADFPFYCFTSGSTFQVRYRSPG